jgi:hypothetical protein
MADQYTIETRDTETTTECSCCGRPVHQATAWLLHGNDDLACYRYRWAEGHDIVFSLAVAATEKGYMRPGFVAVSCHRQGENLSYAVIEPAESPWEDSESLGPGLSRQDALDPNGLYPDLWQLVDTIVEHEPRLAQRITALHGV